MNYHLPTMSFSFAVQVSVDLYTALVSVLGFTHPTVILNIALAICWCLKSSKIKNKITLQKEREHPRD